MADVNNQATAKPLGRWTMNELLDAYPEAAQLFSLHGVDPRSRCHRAAGEYLRLEQVLGRVCPVDDVQLTLRNIAQLIGKEG